MSLAVALALVAPARMPPVDRCPAEAGFVAFRSSLIRAAKLRDLDALVELMDENVRLSFGGSSGKQGFRDLWASKPERRDLLWRELGDALQLGCAMRGASPVFPSMFVQADKLDGFTSWIARPGARLRRWPSRSAPIRGRLSWHVLTADGTWNGGEWIKVRTGDGRRSYVHTASVRSPISYRLFADRRKGEWRITAFIAGD